MKAGLPALDAITDTVLAYGPLRKRRKTKKAKKKARGKKLTGKKQ